MSHLMSIILAAGEGKRMKSRKSKLVHKICGKALIEWVWQAVDTSGIKESIVVVGHKAEQVKACMGDRVRYALQEEQLGTGHAVMQAGEYLENKDGFVFVLYGDTPLVTAQTINDTIAYHKKNGFSATVVTAELKDAAGYGRIIRDESGNVLKIVEHKDASEEERKINEINSGMYCFNIKDLREALKRLTNDNAQGEYYLTDTLEILIGKGLKVGAIKVGDPDEILGINDRVQLYEASEILRKRINTRLMKSGVTIIDPKSTYIDDDAVIGMDTVIYPDTYIEGAAKIGEDCVIGPNTRIVASQLGDGVEMVNSVILESMVGDGAKIGPFAYIRPESKLGRKVKVGDFVEIKKSVIGEKTKIPHLAYIGDAEVGRNTNIACGVITVNYDGKHKHKTVVGDNAFIGCNVNLVAPVEVKSNAYVAAGSTITEEVPGDSLAIARERQVNKEGWVSKKGMQRVEKD